MRHNDYDECCEGIYAVGNAFMNVFSSRLIRDTLRKETTLYANLLNHHLVVMTWSKVV